MTGTLAGVDCQGAEAGNSDFRVRSTFFLMCLIRDKRRSGGQTPLTTLHIGVGRGHAQLSPGPLLSAAIDEGVSGRRVPSVRIISYGYDLRVRAADSTEAKGGRVTGAKLLLTRAPDPCALRIRSMGGEIFICNQNRVSGHANHASEHACRRQSGTVYGVFLHELTKHNDG